MMAVLFWIFFSVIVYTYAGYPFMLGLMRIFFSKKINKERYEPKISIILSAFNEEKHIEKKLLNLLRMDYPEKKIEILVGSDGASDQTDAIISKFASRRIRFFRFVKNLGKAHVLNALAAEAHGTVLLFTDARQDFSSKAIRQLAGNFHDSKVGCVSGELHFKGASEGSVGQGMGLYWKYEKFMRKCESDLGSMLGATGAIYAIRRRLFKPLPPDILVDDMYIPLAIVRKGYRAVFEPNAHAYDQASKSGREEFKRKVRTLSGNWQIVQHFPDLVYPSSGLIAWQFISHKLLRLIVPFLLLGLFLINLALITVPVFQGFFAAQLVFYGLAFFEARREKKRGRKKGIGYLAYTFCLLNWSAFNGSVRFIKQKQGGAWEKAYA